MTTERPTAEPPLRWVGRLRLAVLCIGWVGAIWGVAYAINGATQAHATIKVPVTLTAPQGTGTGNVQVTLPGVVVTDGWFAGAEPDGGIPAGADGTLTLATWGSTVAEQLLGRGDWLVGGLAVLVGALALAPVLGAIAAGDPFRAGTARRLVVVAGAVGVGGMVAPILPHIAGLLVLHRTGLAGPGFVGVPPLTVEPLVVAGVVLAAAAAFRAGERMTRDLDGMV